jgi:hypothetical protein
MVLLFSCCVLIMILDVTNNAKPVFSYDEHKKAMLMSEYGFSHHTNEQQRKTVSTNALFEDLNIGRHADPILEMSMMDVESSLKLLSSQDSDGYLQYTDEQWVRMRAIHQAQSRRQNGRESQVAPEFFQYNWEPTLSCALEQRIGLMGDGGKWICDAYRLAAAEECNVVSIGSNNDWSFEQAIFRLNPHCKIFTFDHTIVPVNVPAYVNFHKIGLGSSDNGQILTLASALKEVGLENKTVDIFKIDCEGCEREIFSEFLNLNLRQILIELHSAYWDVNSFFNALAAHGYVIFHKEPNTYGCAGYCIEYGFIKIPGFIAL